MNELYVRIATSSFIQSLNKAKLVKKSPNIFSRYCIHKLSDVLRLNEVKKCFFRVITFANPL